MSQPAALGYPYLLGGNATANCTTGFVVKRQSDGRRYMSTAGHCSNSQTVGGIDLGPVLVQYNPTLPSPTTDKGADFQIHNTSVRAFDLTNVIRNGSSTTTSVVSFQYKGGTQGNWVCKYGKTTGFTCGQVIDLNFIPASGGDYAPNSGPFVRAQDGWAALYGYDITCPGDSGGPIFKDGIGGVISLGILSGTIDDDCNGGNYYFFYTPIDEINSRGYSILTTHHPQYFYQNIFWSPTNCEQQKIPLDNNGNYIWSGMTTGPCQTTMPPGSGPVQSYTAYAVGDKLHEAAYRGGSGYIRSVPLKSNGEVNWGAAPSWSYCCGGSVPLAQASYIVGNHFFQHVFWSVSNCQQYKVDLDNNGNLNWSTLVTSSCSTSAPGSGTLESYDVHVINGKLHEGIWRGGKGYTRIVPLNSTNTAVNWGSAPGWSYCCTASAPNAQGAYVISHP